MKPRQSFERAGAGAGILSLYLSINHPELFSTSFSEYLLYAMNYMKETLGLSHEKL